MDSRGKVARLRKKYPIFEYQSFHWEKAGEDLLCQWVNKSGNLTFHPQVTIKAAGNRIGDLTVEEIDNLVFHLGLADVFSYWKATCSPKIKISAGSLDSYQTNWWHDLLIQGMGQYFYTNAIDFKAKNFVTIESNKKNFPLPQQSRKGPAKATGVLIPIGGGKDSAVTLDLLTKNIKDQKVGAFAMNLAHSDDILPASKRVVAQAKVTEFIKVIRQLDPQIFGLKSKGYLDGHVPFTAYLSFLSVFLAKLFGYSSVIFSNENSSNEGNFSYLGRNINHQYSKSFEFEQKFRQYNSRYLSSVNYFSFLRPLNELQIMKIFSQMNTYFPLFRSCNIGYKNDSWCGKCPKCLATFVGLLPFVDEKELLRIFKRNILNDKTLLPMTKDILGKGEGKPLECVGTFAETVVAFYLCLKKYGKKKLPILVSYFKTEVLPKYPDIEKLTDTTLSDWDKNNFLPKDYAQLLRKYYELR